MLADYQRQLPKGYPYVFVPPARYDKIQKLRSQGKWTYSDSRLKVITNTRIYYKNLHKKAGIKTRTFHDL
jgi:hypothetical protein